MSGRIKCSVSAGGHRKFSHEDIVSFAIGKGIKISPSQHSALNIKSVITKIVNLTFQNNVKSLSVSSFMSLSTKASLLISLLIVSFSTFSTSLTSPSKS